MSTTVGSHGVASFTNPSNGDALDATIVKGNDNTLRAAYVNHDSDSGIHLQSSALASRPAAGTVGRKWLTTDSGSVKLWYDDGAAWQEVNYVSTSGTTTLSALIVTGNVTVDTDVLVVNATTNRVGINTASPTVALDVTGAVQVSNGLTVTGGGAIVSSGGLVVVGTVTATTFSGSGASLTALPAAELTGTLPAISGVNLTNLNASNLASGTVAAARLPAVMNTATIDGVELVTVSTVPTIRAASTINIRNAQIFGDPSAAPKFDLRPGSTYVFDGNTSAMGTWEIGNSGTTSISTVANPTGFSTRGTLNDRFFRVRSGSLDYFIRLERWT